MKGLSNEQMRAKTAEFKRRLEEGVLEVSESERLWELATLFIRATDVLESEAAAVQWFKNPIRALGWITPLSLARTSVGIRELERVLGRVEHGVFS